MHTWKGAKKMKYKERLNLSEEDKELLVEALLSQGYAYEVVDSELKDLEYELKPGYEAKMRKLNVLLKKLHS
jgi:Antirepressor AbbA